MESKVLIPLIAALTGSLIGALSSFLMLVVQQRAQSKRDKMKLACEMATIDWKTGHDRLQQSGKRGTVAPISVFQHFHYEVLTALEGGNLTAKEMIEINSRNQVIIKAIEDDQK